MKIGILGSGDVAQALGNGFSQLGHQVMLGSRESNNSKINTWIKQGSKGRSGGTFEEAARFGEIVILATLGSATESAIAKAGPSNFDGKVLIDATNPLEFINQQPKLIGGLGSSAGEKAQALLPKARVVKCFNTVGNALMFQPKFSESVPDMFICGNDPAAKESVREICKAFGWGVIDCGGISSSHYLEAMCLVWVISGAGDNHWTQAFKMLRK